MEELLSKGLICECLKSLCYPCLTNPKKRWQSMLKMLTLCSNPKDAQQMVQMLTHNQPFKWRKKLKTLLITKLFQQEDGCIKSISSNGWASQFQTPHGLKIENFNTWIMTLMRDFMHLIYQGWVFLSQGELMETSGSHL